MAFVIALAAIFAVASLHEALPIKDRIPIPGLSWSFDYRFIFEAPILIGALILGVWLYNRPDTADFLIDTETELKSKVTWPSRKEEINASTVVVVAVLVMGVLVFGTDSLLAFVQKLIFSATPPAAP
jgi:preprotein translocase subunit SecE